MNLLYDPLFRVLTDKGFEEVDLPTLMEYLGREVVDRLVGIQRYQADAFHVFLTYLGGAVLVRRGDTSAVQTADYWRTGLTQLAGTAGESAWALVADSYQNPAFMQPPLPKGSKPTSVVYTPDKLDLLQTAKNHDIKQNRADQPHPDEWIYALVSLQTMSGFMGKGNQGISRMNSGFGNRPIVELMRSPRLGRRWIDAVERLLLHRRTVLAQPFGYNPNGLVLVWTKPWDGNEQLDLGVLDPFYIEVCRRVRLAYREGRLQAESYSASKTRIAAKELSGVVGDAWLPVELTGRDGPKALTVSTRGITADLMRRLMFREDFRLSALQSPLPDWAGPLWLTASVLVRGQGTTDGFYEWEVLIPKEKVRLLFGSEKQREPLAEASRKAINYAGIMQNQVLRPAVLTLLQGGPDQLRFDHDTSQAWWTRCAREFEQYWSQEYFPWLLSLPDGFDAEEAERRWVEILRDIALRILDGVERFMPFHSGRRFRAVTSIRNRFWGAYYSDNNFGFMRSEDSESTA